MAYRRPLHEVARWDEEEVAVLCEYLAKQPPAENRLEVAVALLTAKLHNYMKAAGAAPKKIDDFMLFLPNPWADPVPNAGRYNAVDLAIIDALRGASRK